jgi:hypothetical protein
MRRRFSAVISDIGLMEIAIGVALALALVDLAQAIGQTFVYWWRTPVSAFETTGGEDAGTALALENLFSAEGFDLGGRVLDLSYIVGALIEVLLVLGLALWLWPRQSGERRPHEDQA